MLWPSSNSEIALPDPFREFNQCHSPADGKFCTTAGTAMAVASKRDAARMKALRIPPAWTDVKLSVDPKAELQATGVDAKGRTQYRYSAEHSAKAAAEKFARLREFNEDVVTIRDRVDADLANPRLDAALREAATVLYLIDKTAFRIGSDAETGGASQAYGASTLKNKHVRVNGTEVSFDFTGKKGVRIRKTVEDARLAGILAPRLRGERSARLFATTDGAVRDYLKSRDGDFKVKDFRTWHGTAHALREIGKRGIPRNASSFKRAQREVVKSVARFLGNTPAVAKSAYIDPVVWGRWQR